MGGTPITSERETGPIKARTKIEPAIPLQELLNLIAGDLALVERELSREADSGIEPVREISHHLIDGGGKRLRPALHLLAARLCGCQGPSPVRLGAVLEMIHSATLIHDDVIDGAGQRRGRVSTNRQWGNSMTVLAGDWLYMEAFRAALAERNFRVLDVLIGLTQAMVEGELIQLTWLGRSGIGEDAALDIARRKTARLFESSTRLAAVLAGWGPEPERNLARYGENIGLAFQIVDDLLDFTADEGRLGKPVMSDLREGKVTLPLIYALADAAPEDRGFVDEVLQGRALDASGEDRLRHMLKHTGALDRTRERAQQFARTGTEALATLPENEYRTALESIPAFILSRDY